MVVGVAERGVLRVVPAGPEAENDPPPGQVIERRGHLGHEGWVAKRRAHHQRTQLDAGNQGPERAERGPRLAHAFLRDVREPEQQVVEHPDRIEPASLGARGERQGFGKVGRVAVGGVAFGERERDANAHRRSLAGRRRTAAARSLG